MTEAILSPDQLFAEAVRQHQAGDLGKAEALYRALLPQRPGHADLLHLLGVVVSQSGRPAEGAALMRQAIALNPTAPDYYLNLGNASGAAGLTAQASDAYNDLGNLWQRQDRFTDAIAAYDKALALAPDHARALNNRGAALHRLGRYEEAMASAGRALDLQPDFADAAVNLGNALDGSGRRAEAIESFRRALTLRPDMALAHWNLALALLSEGQYAEGWREYEWRWRWPEFSEPERRFAQPIWRGEPADALGGRLLVTAEQGFGDTIQFCRYLPLLARRGYTVIAEVQRPLHTLLWSSFAADGIAVIPRTDTPLVVEGAPAFAVHVPLLSLPERFGTELATIPTPAPYLRADPTRAERWRRRLDGDFRVGLVWAGRPEHVKDRERSIALAAFAPLCAVPGVRFYALQKGPADQDIDASGLPITALGEDLFDFAETAAAVMALDLVIGVDTAVMHLAGALGKPGWVLLSKVPDWRWLRDRTDTPWYDTLRLYRQTKLGDWDEVIDRATQDLKAFISAE
jgi:Flp pilus assembly protein TadD